MQRIDLTTTREYHLLIADDDELYRNQLVQELEDAIPGISITGVATAEEAIQALNDGQRFHLVLTDMRMPSGQEGLQVVEAAADTQPWAEIIVLTAYGDLSNVCEAIERGAGQYIDKNATDFNSILAAMIRRRLPLATARRELHSLVHQGPQRTFFNHDSARPDATGLQLREICATIDVISVSPFLIREADDRFLRIRKSIEQAIDLIDEAVASGSITAEVAQPVKDVLEESI